MNPMYEEGNLLAIRLEGEEVILRLDRHGLAYYEATDAQKPIVTLTLRGITDEAKRDALLRLPNGSSISCEICEQPDGTCRVTVDEDCFIELDCAAASQEVSDYTREDIIEKFRKLSAIYYSEWNRDTAELHQAHRFQAELLRDVGRERERCERKRDFFQKIEPAKSDRLDAQIQAYDRVLTIMEFLRRQYSAPCQLPQEP